MHTLCFSWLMLVAPCTQVSGLWIILVTSVGLGALLLAVKECYMRVHSYMATRNDNTAVAAHGAAGAGAGAGACSCKGLRGPPALSLLASAASDGGDSLGCSPP